MGALAKEIQALETTEKVIARLSLAPGRDAIIDRLIAAIEADRAALLAAMVLRRIERQVMVGTGNLDELGVGNRLEHAGGHLQRQNRRVLSANDEPWPFPVGAGFAFADPWGVLPCMPREQFSGLPRAWLPPAPSRGENESPGFFPSGWGSCFG